MKVLLVGGAGHVGLAVVGCVLIEEHVAAERTESGEKMQRLPRVSAERIPHQVAGQHDSRRHHALRRPRPPADG